MNNDEIKAKYGYDEGKDKIDLMLNEVRADTAQQIFKEIDELFLTDNPRTQLTPMTYKAYQATKKKYGVKK